MEVTGVLLRVDSQYVCWHSHRAEFELGPRHRSEIFAWSWWFLTKTGPPDLWLERALARYPSAGTVLV